MYKMLDFKINILLKSTKATYTNVISYYIKTLVDSWHSTSPYFHNDSENAFIVKYKKIHLNLNFMIPFVTSPYFRLSKQYVSMKILRRLHSSFHAYSSIMIAYTIVSELFCFIQWSQNSPLL